MNVVMLGKPGGEPLLRRGAGHRRGRCVLPGRARRAVAIASGGLSEIMALQAEMVSVPPPPRPLGR